MSTDGRISLPPERTIPKVDPKTLDAYVGVYRGSGLVFTITREGEQLFAQLIGQPRFPMFPESERRFFLKVVDAKITFDVDSEGRARQLTLDQNGGKARDSSRSSCRTFKRDQPGVPRIAVKAGYRRAPLPIRERG